MKRETFRMVRNNFSVSIYVSFDDLTFKLTNKARSERPFDGDRDTAQVLKAWESPLPEGASVHGHSQSHSRRYL